MTEIRRNHGTFMLDVWKKATGQYRWLVYPVEQTFDMRHARSVRAAQAAAGMALHLFKRGDL